MPALKRMINGCIRVTIKCWIRKNVHVNAGMLKKMGRDFWSSVKKLLI